MRNRGYRRTALCFYSVGIVPFWMYHFLHFFPPGFDRGSRPSGGEVLRKADVGSEQRGPGDHFAHASWCHQDDRHPEEGGGAAGMLLYRATLPLGCRVVSTLLLVVFHEGAAQFYVVPQQASSVLSAETGHLRHADLWPDDRCPAVFKGVTFRMERGEMVITRILHGSSIDRQGMLHVGDVIREVNGREVGSNPQDLQELLRDCSGSITLKVLPSYRDAPAPPQVRGPHRSTLGPRKEEWDATVGNLAVWPAGCQNARPLKIELRWGLLITPHTHYLEHTAPLLTVASPSPPPYSNTLAPQLKRRSVPVRQWPLDQRVSDAHIPLLGFLPSHVSHGRRVGT